MYHDIGSGAVRRPGTNEDFSVSVSVFERQLKVLSACGRRGFSIERVLRDGPAGGVAVSFDDGNEGQYRHAFPLLVREQMAATFFVTTGWVGQPGYISWEGLREMKAAGMEIGSHTHTHLFLSELRPDEVRCELVRAKELLDDQLEQDTRTLALPGGDLPPGGWAPLAEAGYRTVATSRWGRNPLGGRRRGAVTTIRRCTIREVDERGFTRILRGDAWIACRKWVRETTLGSLRRALGASRYSAWRKRMLVALARQQ
jgi:peptidoglycan/xylan/chitin deacetylase (PgdA/CDA1 family)